MYKTQHDGTMILWCPSKFCSKSTTADCLHAIILRLWNIIHKHGVSFYCSIYDTKL